MTSTPHNPYIVAIAQRAKGDGIAEVIADELIALGYQPVHFEIGSPVPVDAKVVFSFGPYGRFLAVPCQLAPLPPDRKPVFVHWNTEGIPDPKIPWRIVSAVSGLRSWFGRAQESLNGSAPALGKQKLISLNEARMLRFRYVGDYYYARRQGWLDVFADSSEIYAQIHRQNGLPTIVTPWGAIPRWYEDLELERDIDVLWMGTRGTRRRSRILDRVRRELSACGVRMHIADGVENPFIFDRERIHYLNRSKITLNITRTWYDDNFSRFAMAAPNRSLIVSEPVLPHCPTFEAGVHYVSAPIESLAESILYYLEHEDERLSIVENAYRLVTESLTFRESVKKVMDAAVKAYRATHSVHQYAPLELSSNHGRYRRMDESLQSLVSRIHDYWNSHTLGYQYVTDPNLKPGSPEFFAHIRPWMNPYKFSWIMARIEREAEILRGKHLLEVGCGMGYDSVEFLERGVRVTATDLTPNAVKMACRHFEIQGVRAEDVRTANALDLPYEDNTFDAVWANGVLHDTGNTAGAISEVHRVLKPGGRAIISHFYRKPSWMYLLNRLGRENIEYKEEDPPVNEFLTERQIIAMFDGFKIIEAVPEHYRALPVNRRGLKAALYKYGFMPVYNLIPEAVARRLAYKFSVTAVKI